MKSVAELLCWVNFSTQLYLAPIFLLLFFFNIFSLLIFSFCSRIIFLSSCSIFMMVILNYLSGNSYTSIPLGLVLGDLFYCLYWALFSYFFMYFITFCWDPHFWKNSLLFNSLQTALFRERPSPFSLFKDLGWGSCQIFPLLHLLWTCACKFSVREIYISSFLS